MLLLGVAFEISCNLMKIIFLKNIILHNIFITI